MFFSFPGAGCSVSRVNEHRIVQSQNCLKSKIVGDSILFTPCNPEEPSKLGEAQLSFSGPILFPNPEPLVEYVINLSV